MQAALGCGSESGRSWGGRGGLVGKEVRSRSPCLLSEATGRESARAPWCHYVVVGDGESRSFGFCPRLRPRRQKGVGRKECDLMG